VGNLLRPLVADVVYECRRAGTAALAVTYRFADSRLAPVVLHIVKECTHRARWGLCIGTSADSAPEDDVVKNGVSRWTTTTATQRIVPSTTSLIELFLRLRPTSGVDDTVSQLMLSPRVAVTTLGVQRGRGRRRLLAQAAREDRLQRRLGIWGLAGARGTVPEKEEVVRVRVEGALARGGTLQTTSMEPPRGSLRPALRVEFDCLRRGSALIEVEFAPFPKYQPYRPIVITFVKQCGGGVRHGFDVSTRPLASHTGLADLLRDGTAVPGSPLRVGSLLAGGAAARIYWRSRDGSHGPPDATRLSCSDGVSGMALAPVAAKAGNGALVGHQDFRLSCAKTGAVQCVLSFGWRLYRGPALHLRKVCQGVSVVVRAQQDPAFVLLQGQDDHLPLPSHARSTKMTLPPEENTTVFTVSLDRALSLGEDALRIASPELRISRPDIVKGRIVGELAHGGAIGAMHASGVSDDDGVADLEVEVECLQWGRGTSSLIEVILPIAGQGSKPSRFSFVKSCDAASSDASDRLFICLFGAAFLLTCAILGLVMLSAHGTLDKKQVQPRDRSPAKGPNLRRFIDQEQEDSARGLAVLAAILAFLLLAAWIAS